MNPLSDFNDAMKYIEQNLCGKIDFGRLAQIAGCSEYHFRRVFSYLANMPIGEYIRTRRLTVAAELIRDPSTSFSDVALRLGYESSEAFGKAFASLHGASLAHVRSGRATAKAFPPMTFQLTIQGGMALEYRIVSKEAFTIVGYMKQISVQYVGVNPQMESLTALLTPEVVAELKGMSDSEPTGMLSVSANFDDRLAEGTKVDQWVGVACTKPMPDIDRYSILPVEASTWTVFTSIGPFPDTVQNTWAKIFAEWLPSSGFELSGGPEILWNESPDISRSDYKSEIWIPVRAQ